MSTNGEETKRRSRIVSEIEETWGRGTIFEDVPEEVQQIVEEYEPDMVISVQDVFGLPYFQSCLFATVLEDTITELRILAECNNEMRISKTINDMGLLLALKYSVEQPASKDELEGIEPHKLGCIEYKLNKLDADRKYISGAVMSTYLDLSLRRSFKAIVEKVNDIVNLDSYRVFLQEDEAKNRVFRRELTKQLRQQRIHIRSVTYDTDVVIDDLKTQVEDASLNSEIRSRYIENWQLARTEQNHQTIRDKESTPSESVEYFKQRTDHEQRVHTEVELLINIAINETLEKVEEWMNKYDKDMEAIDLKIQIKKNDYQNMLDKRVGLEDTIELHDKLMKDWIHFKEEREKARQYREKMTNSAIIVQAWWRGLLVRKQLGPYKVIKKKGGKGAKK